VADWPAVTLQGACCSALQKKKPTKKVATGGKHRFYVGLGPSSNRACCLLPPRLLGFRPVFSNPLAI